MNFPGPNKLILSDAAICAAIEGTLNAARRGGEDYVHVTELTREGFGYGSWVAHITTDSPADSVVTLAAEAA